MQNTTPHFNGTFADLLHLGEPSETERYELNLAGATGTPTSEEVLHPPTPPEIHSATFTAPDSSTPGLSKSDFGVAALDTPPGLSPDPPLPDLTAYPQPIGLAIYDADPLAPDPFLHEPLASEIPPQLQFREDPLHPDTLLPDLAHAPLTPQQSMPQRPGDLAAEALAYAASSPSDYVTAFSHQLADNSSRARHMALLLTELQ